MSSYPLAGPHDVPDSPGDVDLYECTATGTWCLRVGARTQSGELVWLDAGEASTRDLEIFGLRRAISSRLLDLP